MSQWLVYSPERVGREAGFGDVAQLGEHRVCNAGVVGSSPIISTTVLRGVLDTMIVEDPGLWMILRSSKA